MSYGIREMVYYILFVFSFVHMNKNRKVCDIPFQNNNVRSLLLLSFEATKMEIKFCVAEAAVTM